MDIEMKTPELPNLHPVNCIHQGRGGIKSPISMLLTNGQQTADNLTTQPGVSVPASGRQDFG